MQVRDYERSESKSTEIRLPDVVVDYLQQMDYEIAGLQVLHTHALNAGVAAEKVEEIRQQFQDKYAEYQVAKNEMWLQYGQGYPNSRWWVDFQEGVLHITDSTCGGGESDA